MPKCKTNKAAAKRFRKKKSGKIRFKKKNLRHLLTGRSRKEKRQKRTPGYVSTANAGKIRALLPYG
jgi:large subunit ribosomal protein L35